MIRNGGIGYVGQTESATSSSQGAFLSEIFAHNSSLGEMFVNVVNFGLIDTGFRGPRYSFVDARYFLLGDPTLKLKVPYQMPKPELYFVNEDNNGKNYKLIIPAMKIDIPLEYRWGGCGIQKEDPRSLYFTTGYTHRNLIRNNNFVTKFNALRNFDSNTISPEWLIYKDYSAEDYELWIESPITGGTGFSCPDPGDYFLTAKDYEFTNYEFDISLSEGGGS